MLSQTDIAEAILETVRKRGAEKSTCPSEIARMLFPSDWRNHMKEILDVAVELNKKGSVLLTQKGIPIDVQPIKGPVRIKVKRP